MRRWKCTGCEAPCYLENNDEPAPASSCIYGTPKEETGVFVAFEIINYTLEEERNSISLRVSDLIKELTASVSGNKYDDAKATLPLIEEQINLLQNIA